MRGTPGYLDSGRQSSGSASATLDLDTAGARPAAAGESGASQAHETSHRVGHLLPLDRLESHEPSICHFLTRLSASRTSAFPGRCRRPWSREGSAPPSRSRRPRCPTAWLGATCAARPPPGRARPWRSGWRSCPDWRPSPAPHGAVAGIRLRSSWSPPGSSQPRSRRSSRPSPRRSVPAWPRSTAASGTASSWPPSETASTSSSPAPGGSPTSSSGARSTCRTWTSWSSTKPTGWPTWASCRSVRRLIDKTSASRQTLLFSATLDGPVDKLIRDYQHNPARHDVEPADTDQGEVAPPLLAGRAPRPGRGHRRDDRRPRAGRGLLPDQARGGPSLGPPRPLRPASAAIHGNRSQSQRERALAAFRAGRLDVLVATDIAARGIHVDAVPLVVHFDPPADPTDYVHRSGRTGRAGADGIVVSLVGDEHIHGTKLMQRKLGLSERDLVAGRACAGRRPGWHPPCFAPARSEGQGNGSASPTKRRDVHPRGKTRRTTRSAAPVGGCGRGVVSSTSSERTVDADRRTAGTPLNVALTSWFPRRRSSVARVIRRSGRPDPDGSSAQPSARKPP